MWHLDRLAKKCSLDSPAPTGPRSRHHRVVGFASRDASPPVIWFRPCPMGATGRSRRPSAGKTAAQLIVLTSDAGVHLSTQEPSASRVETTRADSGLATLSG